MDKLLSDQRLLVFLGAVLVAVGGWGAGFQQWSEMFHPQAIFGLFVILGGVLGANAAHNIWVQPPTITETTTPKSSTTTTVTTPAESLVGTVRCGSGL